MLPLCAAASSPAPLFDSSARQNLLFGWNAIPQLLERCLASSVCAGTDRRMMEDLLRGFRLPADTQPAFVFVQDRDSEFCRNNRDVYGTDRIWSAPIKVCEPRLYEAVSGAPLWSAEVAVNEMMELAFLKSSPLDENVVADITTRIVELSNFEVRELRYPLEGLEALRLVSISDPDRDDMGFAMLLAPGMSYDIVASAWAVSPCELKGGVTKNITLGRPHWNSDGQIDGYGAASISGSAEAVVGCLEQGHDVSYAALLQWSLSFDLRAPTIYENPRFSADFQNLRVVSPAP
ncbi:MAG: hypothetical protein ABIR96_11865 [Bdellovibrionota bacterium]